GATDKSRCCGLESGTEVTRPTTDEQAVDIPRFTSGTSVLHTSPMANRTGSADLPLHGGFVPPWLVTRMASLGRVIVEAIVHHYGRDELLRRLAHPFWFQSFGAV